MFEDGIVIVGDDDVYVFVGGVGVGGDDVG